MHYCCEICICFSSTQTQGHTYTHAAEEVNPQSIGNPNPFPITSNGSEPSTTKKKRQSHCQNQQISSHSTAGALVSSLERNRHMSEGERETGREQEKERIGGEREESKRERRGVSICPSPGSH